MTFLAACLGVARHVPAALCSAILDSQTPIDPPCSWADVNVALAASAVPLLASGDTHACGDTADGRWRLAWDARLDDRRNLARSLGLGGTPGCGALLLAAWQRWGRDTPDYLCGDYAVIAWDRIDQALVLTRDPFGPRPLFFRAVGAGFACASLPAGLGRPLGATLEPDLNRLTRDLNHRLDSGRASVFAEVERVEPGTQVVLRAGRAPESRRWWRPDTSPLHGRSLPDWADALRDALFEAAADRVPDGGASVASHLSGGLDSAGVTAAAVRAGSAVVGMTAAPTPAAPLTAPLGRLADESVLAALAASALGIDQVAVSAEQSFATMLDDAFAHLPLPMPNPLNYPWAEAIFAETARRGIDVLLCGQSGNFTFSVADRGRRPGWSSAIRAFVPSAIRARLRGIRSDPGAWTLAATILPAELPREPADQGLAILRAMDPGALMRGSFLRWGVDLRDVTADRRLAELALRIPDDVRSSGGRDRAPARQALAGLVPNAVCLSTQRGYQAADWLHNMTQALPAIRQEVSAIARSPVGHSLIDMPRLQRLVDDWPRSTAYDADVERLYRYVVPQAIATAGWARRAAGET